MTRLALLVGLCIASSVACRDQAGTQQEKNVPSTTRLGDADIVRLASKRVFFGHQSVGRNIMDGVADLAREHEPAALMIVGPETAEGISTGGFFAHGLVGKNRDPQGKTDAFVRVLQDGLGARLDIAFHKYCYLDVVEGTDVATLFANYKHRMAGLRTAFPGVTFVHVTVPLKTVQSGPKALLKALLGRLPSGFSDNLRRSEFNALMLREYSEREPVFDLAALESTTAGGEVELVEANGRAVRSLVSSYTDDGGHLNTSARRRIAEALCLMLSQLPDAK